MKDQKRLKKVVNNKKEKKETSSNKNSTSKNFYYSFLTIILFLCLIQITISAILNVSKVISYNAKIVQITKTRDTAKALNEIAGISVFENEQTGELKNMPQLIDEIASKWSSFTEEQRAGLSEGIAGKEQAAVFQSLMSNYDTMKQVQQELNEGMHFGSALAENEQYVDSLNGKLNKLKEVWVGIFNKVFDSNSAKGLLDVLISC